MTPRIILTLSLCLFLLYSCDSSKKSSSEQEATSVPEESNEILLSPVKDSPDFNDAILEMNAPVEYAQEESGVVSFSYNVKNYDLKAQTSDAGIKECANSGQGQHIHLILNNEPYTAHYDPAFTQELNEGHYVALSFLSRSYHESLKTPDAYVLRQFNVGNASEEDTDLSGPNLFYSRPKGTYTGPDTKKLLLDFYLVNCDLSKEGYKVRATINGQEFILSEWVPYFVEGLPLGENTFQLELIDAEGVMVDSPFNKVTRTITLSEDNPA